MRDALVFAAFSLALISALRRPWVGVLVYVCLAYLNPGRLCYGRAYLFPFSLVGVIVLLASLMFSREKKRIPFTRETIILILFACWMTVTTFTALNSTAAWPKWNQAVKILFMALVVLATMNSRKRLESFVWTIVLSLGYYGVRGGIGTILTGGSYRVYGPDDTFIADNNDLALALVSVIPLGLYAVYRAKGRLIKIGTLAIVFCIAIAVIGTYSRAGLLALGAVAFLLCWRSRYRIATTGLVMVLTSVLWFAAPSAWTSRMKTIGEYKEDASAMGRINAWHFAVNLAHEYPVTGGGFEAFAPEFFRRYAPDPEDYHAAHSIYFKVLGEHGYVGLALFVLLWCCTWLTAQTTRRQAAYVPGAEWIVQLVEMAQVAMVGYAVGGAFGNQCYFDMPYHLMAIIVRCKLVLWEKIRTVQAEQEDSEKASTEPESLPVFQPAYES